MSANLILGSSHAMVLARAAGRFEGDWKTASCDLIRVETASGAETQILFATNRPAFLELGQAPGGGISATFGPLMDKVRAFDRPDATVILGIGGNEHNIRFLCAQPRPFDFAHPSAPAIEPGRQVIPLREMQAILRGLLERTLLVTRLIAAELPRARRYYLPPPPPIPSEAQIRTNPAIFDFDANGIESASVRLKIYNLYLEIAAAFCEANGITFLPLPAAHRDDAGFLREAYWEGSTHATPDYYAPIVAELGL
jgi:hypothetical protein